jgi:sec-independent protein translocase protein TatB
MTASLGVQAFIFDVGWGELVLIGIVALIVIGPKELPAVLRTFGQYMTKIRRMAAEFQSQFQEAMREAEMAELKQQFDAIHDAAKDLRGFDPVGTVRDQIETAAAEKPADPNQPASTATTPSAEPAPPPAAENPAPVTDPLASPPAPASAEAPASAAPPEPSPPTPEGEGEVAAAAGSGQPEGRKGQPG